MIFHVNAFPMECSSFLFDRDAESIQIMRLVRKSLKDWKPDEVAVQDWLTGIEMRINHGQKLTIMEHSALLFIHNTNFFDIFPKLSFQKSQISEIIIASRKLITGKRNEYTHKAFEMLPRSILKRATEKERVFHVAALQSLAAKTVTGRLEYLRNAQISFVDGVVGLALLAYSFSITGMNYLATYIISYFHISMVEHHLHRFAGHASREIREYTKKKWWLKWLTIEDTWRSHTVFHHGMAAINYTIQKIKGDSLSSWEKKANRINGFLNYLRSVRWGTSLNTEGVAYGMLATLPGFTIILITLEMTPLMLMGLITPAALHVMASKYLHPYLHETRVEAMEQAPNELARILLDTRYARMISRYHFVHHKNPEVNFNLVWLADLMMGTIRTPNFDHIIEMYDRGIIGAAWEH